MRIVVTDINDVEKIVRHVHDRFFWLDNVLFSNIDHTLKISSSVLGEESIVRRQWISKRKMDMFYSELLVHNVIDYKVVDEAGIGIGDIDRIFLENKSTLCIRCSLPVYINVHISSLDLELNISDQVIDSVEYFVYPFSNKRLNPKEFRSNKGDGSPKMKCCIKDMPEGRGNAL